MKASMLAEGTFFVSTSNELWFKFGTLALKATAQAKLPASTVDVKRLVDLSEVAKIVEREVMERPR